MNSKLPYLNVGCGFSYHVDWTNVDFVSTGGNVIAYNLVKGIPFPDDSFEVVYHSHVLEHFSKKDGERLIRECNRVLKDNGIIRVAIPDLEKIVQQYTRILSLLKENKSDEYLQKSYDWIMLEMYDQTVRNKGGGEMIEFLSSENLMNEAFVLERCGYEARDIIEACRSQRENSRGKATVTDKQNKSTVKQKIKDKLLKRWLGENYALYHEIGKFRSSGEIHQWMYDEYSLGMLLGKSGFKNIKICSAYESKIKDWEKFGLEIVDGNIRKPDSLFMEATK